MVSGVIFGAGSDKGVTPDSSAADALVWFHRALRKLKSVIGSDGSEEQSRLSANFSVWVRCPSWITRLRRPMCAGPFAD